LIHPSENILDLSQQPASFELEAQDIHRQADTRAVSIFRHITSVHNRKEFKVKVQHQRNWMGIILILIAIMAASCSSGGDTAVV